jgi:hypothetical protein
MANSLMAHFARPLHFRPKVAMPMRSSNQKKTAPAGEKGRIKFAERKRVLKHGSDGDVVRAFATKKERSK